MPVDDSTKPSPELIEDALKDLDAEDRATYAKVLAGLDKLDAQLPAECTPENHELIGDVIARSKKAEKFANESFKAITGTWAQKIVLQRLLWKPLWERASTITAKATALVETLIRAEAKKREEKEKEARALVAENAAKQAAAEAKALAAETPEAQVQAMTEADAAWNASRAAVSALDKAPAQTSVKLGATTVFEVKRLDYDVVDIAAFAKAHPDLVEIKRGATLAGLREALSGYPGPTPPETVAGWPGLKVKLNPKTSAR